MKNYTLERIDKAWLIIVSDTYIDFKKKPEDKDFRFAMLDPSDWCDKTEFDHVVKRLREQLKEGREVDLILERRPGKPNPKQMMDYVVHCAYW